MRENILPKNEESKRLLERLRRMEAEQRKEENRKFLQRLPIYLLTPVFICLGFMALTLPHEILVGDRHFWFWQDFTKLKSRGNSTIEVGLDSATYLVFYCMLFVAPYYLLRLVLAIGKPIVDNQTYTSKTKIIFLSIWVSTTVFFFHSEIIFLVNKIVIDDWQHLIKLGFFSIVTLFCWLPQLSKNQ
jgi:hypothetical protein